jgi:prepilin-type N-terminal cleavage/methylation domain-containing protein
MKPGGDRHGFTLVELLVVAGIMVVLFGLVTAGTHPGASGQIRNTAQSLASVLASTQSHALGRPNGAAVIFESGTTAGLSANACVRLFHADSPPLITGTATAAPVPLSGTSAVATVRLVPDNASPEDLVNGYLVQFGGVTTAPGAATQPASDWFTLACTGTADGAAICKIGFRTSAGQTTNNTIWPEPTRTGSSSQPLAFRAARYPVQGDVTLQCGKAVAIDLRFSGIGDDPASAWSSLGGKGAISIGFDSVGRVDDVMQHALGPADVRAIQSIAPAGPIYLFLTTREEIEGNTGLRSQQAVWIVVHPQTGHTSVAANVPQAGADATALRAARFNALAGINLGR